MRVIAANERFAEARVYVFYVLAVFRPGIEVPTFGHPKEFTNNVNDLNDEDLKIVVEEGRRQLDRQLADLEKNKSRAATMLTVGLAEIGVLAAGANRAFSHGPWTTMIWAVSTTLALLALGGAVSLLTSRAVFGRVDAPTIAAGPTPVLKHAALGYAQSAGWGEETIRTRITVLRDGVLLAVASAMLYALIWPVISGTPGQSKPQPNPTGVLTTCPATCTPSLPSSSPPNPSPAGTLEPSRTSSAPAPAPSTRRP